MPRINKNHRKYLMPKQIQAVVKLAHGEDPKDIAQDLSVTVGTVRYWQTQPLFQERLADHLDFLAKEALDVNLSQARLDLNKGAPIIAQWMQRVITGELELKREDLPRWKMALEYLHHCGILDLQHAPGMQAPSPAGNQVAVNIGLDQRRQSILASGNALLEAELAKFDPPD